MFLKIHCGLLAPQFHVICRFIGLRIIILKVSLWVVGLAINIYGYIVCVDVSIQLRKFKLLESYYDLTYLNGFFLFKITQYIHMKSIHCKGSITIFVLIKKNNRVFF